MPAGCEFYCNNENCSAYRTGFSMTAPWPMGNICIVINSAKVKHTPDLKEHMVAAKNAGKKYGCINYPDIDDIEIEAYRVQLWSPKANCFHEFYVEAGDEEELTDNLPYANIPDKCPTTGGPLFDFNETTRDGILCPHCERQLHQNRWFTNET